MPLDALPSVICLDIAAEAALVQLAVDREYIGQPETTAVVSCEGGVSTAAVAGKSKTTTQNFRH